MRPIYPSDLDQATRDILRKDAPDQADHAAQLLSDADTADRYRKKLRKTHPVLGDGTLAGAISAPPDMPNPMSCDAAYMEALRVIVEAIRARREAHISVPET